ncbi:MAG: DUF3039 domain-containing protein [Flaviflexus sp.]|nr:DUF3039 domain-containing protein [Brevibacterium aurantiacum]
MDYIRRVTIRCLCEDLNEGWDDVAQQRSFQTLRDLLEAGKSDSEIARSLESVPTVSKADHPLVRSFSAAFEAGGSGVRRESISGLTDPYWWKQKVSRWRGAATDAETVGDGEVWLCAGGLRSVGDDRDFYKTFTHQVSVNGSSKFLPSESDRKLQAIEEKISRKEAWNRQVQLSALVCLDRAYSQESAVSFHVPGPSPTPVEEPLMHLEFAVSKETIDGEELAELLLSVSSQDTSKPYLAEDALGSIREIVEPVVERWRLLPGPGGMLIWSTILSADLIATAKGAVELGELPEGVSKSGFRFAVRAHYAKAHSLVDATVEGDPVRGLCGTWFVPTADPSGRDICPICAGRYEELDSGGLSPGQ